MANLSKDVGLKLRLLQNEPWQGLRRMSITVLQDSGRFSGHFVPEIGPFKGEVDPFALRSAFDKCHHLIEHRTCILKLQVDAGGGQPHTKPLQILIGDVAQGLMVEQSVPAALLVEMCFGEFLYSLGNRRSYDAFFLRYKVVVPENLVMATSPQAQEVTLYDIDTHYGDVSDLEAVLAVLARKRDALR